MAYTVIDRVYSIFIDVMTGVSSGSGSATFYNTDSHTSYIELTVTNGIQLFDMTAYNYVLVISKPNKQMYRNEYTTTDKAKLVIEMDSQMLASSGNNKGQLYIMKTVDNVSKVLTMVEFNYIVKEGSYNELAPESTNHDALYITLRNDVDSILKKIENGEIGGGSGGTGMTATQKEQLTTAYNHAMSDAITTTDEVNSAVASYVEANKDALKGDKGDRGENGNNGKDGLTTAVSVNGNTYTHKNGTITLPNYPTVPTKTSQLTNDSGFLNADSTIDADSLNGKKFSNPMTKQEYDSITEKDTNTIYLVDDDSSVISVPNYSVGDANKVLAVSSDGTTIKWSSIPSSGGGLTIRDIEPNEIFSVSDGGEATPIYGNIVLSTTALSVNENATETFTIVLSQAPTNDQTVNISVSNRNCSVDKSSLTFTKDNYNVAQKISITGTHSSTDYTDLTSIITVSSANVNSQQITVTIKNIDIEKNVSSIAAEYNQGDTVVYPSTPLNSLKDNLKVTATYTDNTSSTVTDYTLSGALSEGTSTITVSYQGKTTTFSVTVSAGKEMSPLVSLETIDDTSYLSLVTETGSDGTPVDYLFIEEKTAYSTDLYRYFTLNLQIIMGISLSRYSDFSKHIINGYTKVVGFNAWRADANVEESFMINNNVLFCKVATANITSGSTTSEIFKYINNNILQHNTIKVNALDDVTSLTASDLCSYITDSATVTITSDKNNVLIRTGSSPFGSSIASIALLNSYGWYGKPLNINTQNSGFAVGSASAENVLFIALPREHFVSDNLELTAENCRTIITKYYSDIKVFSPAKVAIA